MAGFDITAITGMLQQKKSQVMNTIPNLAKGLFGAIQARKAGKGISNLMANQVTYKRPEEYAQELSARNQMVSQSQLPGIGQITDNIGSAAASARSALKEGAISSNVYNRGVGDVFAKQVQAYQDLGIKSAEFQQKQKEGRLTTLQRGGDFSDTEWTQNKLYPWELQMNMLQSQKQAGVANAWGGTEGMQTSANNFAGTSYAQQIMSNLMGKNASIGGTVGGGGGTQQAMGQGSKSLLGNELIDPLTGFTKSFKIGQ
jgi:hypothetical protein